MRTALATIDFRGRGVACVAILLAVAVAGWKKRLFCVDDGFIFARYGSNLATGSGWVFNPGEPVNATTSVGWTLLLAGIARFATLTPQVFVGLHCLAIAALGLAVLSLLRSAPAGQALLAALLVVLVGPLWESVGLESAFAAALVAWTLVAHQRGWWKSRGLLLGLSVLARPDALLLGALLFVADLWQERRLRAGSFAIATLVVAPWIAFALVRFGSPLPNTLAIKMAQATVGFWATQPGFARAVLVCLPHWPLFLGLAAIGLIRRSPGIDSGVTLYIAYGVLHAVAYSVLGLPADYVWYFAPFATAVVVASVLGAWRLRSGKLAVAIGLLLVGVLLHRVLRSPGVYRLSPEYTQAARWLESHTEPSDTVAATEIGYIGYVSRRPVLDMHALLHPEEVGAIREGRSQWWLSRAPALVVTHDPPWYGEPHANSKHEADADRAFDEGYRAEARFDSPRMGGVVIWRRRG